MKYLKNFEKHKGNYLTKQDQPKNNFNDYLYDNGFGDRFYICSNCDSYKLTPTARGGMQPPEWVCDDCSEKNYAPKWMSPDEYFDYIKNKAIIKKGKKYNIL